MSDCRRRCVAPWADLPFTEKGLDFSEPIKDRHPFGWRSFIGLFHDEYWAFDVVDDILTDTPHDEGGDSALAAVADDDHIDALLLYDLRNSGTRDAGLYDLFIVELDRDLFLQRSEQSFCLGFDIDEAIFIQSDTHDRIGGLADISDAGDDELSAMNLCDIDRHFEGAL